MTYATGDIAIVGMACLFPKAPDLATFWRNILAKVDAIGEMADDSNADLIYDPQASANDRIYTKRGGFLGDLARFNPLEYGVMPRSVDGGEPEHFLALRVAHEAIADADYLERPFNRERTGVILGRATYVNRGYGTAFQYTLAVEQTINILKALHPEHTDDELEAIRREFKAQLPPFNAETAPSLVPSVMCGRIANRLDLMGPAYAVDAACASSLIAVAHAIDELRSGRCDMVLSGGVQASSTFPIAQLFCNLGALSRRGTIRSFHPESDGMLLGEGAGIVVLKRREDAERDGDRVYAVIKSVGTASDGRALGVLAPRVEGEETAMRRAYAEADIAPQTVELVDGHGTGTPVGDATEIEALSRVFGPRLGAVPSTALGSIKSMIGHTIPAAGVAGLIKTSLALYHKVLPPTLHVEAGNEKLSGTALYLNSETRPWIHGRVEPRRGAVSAFGFGGINAHAILEEHTAENAHPNIHQEFDSEIVILSAPSRDELVARAEHLCAFLKTTSDVALRDIAYTLNCNSDTSTSLRLAIVASSLSELEQKLTHALKRLTDPACHRIKERGGIYFTDQPLAREGKVAFLFPGEGSQYANMLADLCLHFPEVRGWFDLMDRAIAQHGRDLLPSQVIFPPPTGTEGADEDKLWRMDVAAEAVFTANQALFTLLSRLAIRPQQIAGHSTGEHSAVFAGGSVRMKHSEQLVEPILALNRIYEELLAEGKIPEATLLAVSAAKRETVEALVAASNGQLSIAMDNCPHQIVLCGTPAEADRARERLAREGAVCMTLPFSRAYHTPLFRSFSERMAAFLEQLQELELVAPAVETYSCATAAPFSHDPAGIRSLLAEQWARPVRFRETVEAMYAAGARIFVEVGPRGNLSSFVDDILRGRPYLGVPANVQHRSGITQLNHLIGLLAVHGVAMDLAYLYEQRGVQRVSLDTSESHVEVRHSDRMVKVANGLPVLNLNADALQRIRETPAKANGTTTAVAATTITQGVAPRTGSASNAPRVVSPAPTKTNGAAANDATTGELLPHQSAAAVEAVPSRHVEQRGAAHRAHTAPQPSRAPTRAGPRNNAAVTAVMGRYLGEMEQFLTVQERVTQAFFGRGPSAGADGGTRGTALRPRSGGGGAPTTHRPPAVGAGTHGEHGASSYRQPGPLIGSLISLIPGKELVSQRRINLQEDVFLHDHALGRNVASTDQQLTGLPVVPFTVSMEMLAEASAALLPGKVVVGMKHIRAHRWIALGEDEVVLRLVARRMEAPMDDEVVVQVYDDGAAQAPPFIEGTVLFADRYPQAPPAGAFALVGDGPSSWRPDRLYEDGMFHGPAFRGVASIDRVGDTGCEATLDVLPLGNLFASGTGTHMVTDPVLLDQPGQVVAFWLAERFDHSYVIFPFHLEALELYGPNLWPHEQVKCRVRVTHLDDIQMRSDLEIVRSDGMVWGRLIGWEDRRFDVPAHFFRFMLAPAQVILSRPWELSTPPELAGVEVYRLGLDDFPPGFLSAHGGIWQRVLAHATLSRGERETWRALRTPEPRRLEWLLARVAAKDAVRRFVHRRYGLVLCPADIEIIPDPAGRPLIQGAWTRQIQRAPIVSLSHTSGVAVAAVYDGISVAGVGIDIESRTRMNDDVARLAFTPQERALLDSVVDGAAGEWTMRAWCAKETVAKAVGVGMIGGPQALVVQAVDPRRGTVTILLTGEIARRIGRPGGVTVEAATEVDGDIVWATCLYI